MASRCSCASAPRASIAAEVFMVPYDITAILVMSTGPRPVRALPGLHRGANHPELGKELELQRLGEIRGAARTAGAGFIANHAFHGLEVMEAPQLEFLVQVSQALRQLVQVPVLFRVVI